MAVNYNTEFSELNGLERVRRIEQHRDPYPGSAVYYGYQISWVEPGCVVLEFTPDESHLNFFQTVHGGVLAGVLDSAMGFALVTVLNPGEHNTITDLHTKYLRPVRSGGETYRVEGRIQHRGRRQCTMVGELCDAAGRLCVSATGTGMILEPGSK